MGSSINVIKADKDIDINNNLNKDVSWQPDYNSIVEQSKSIEEIDINSEKTSDKKIGKIQENFTSDIDLTPYKEKLSETLNNSNSKRDSVSNLALFIAVDFPKLPYLLDYSSGHDGSSLVGLDWTKDIVQREDGSDGNRTLDCSGLVSWCFQNSGVEVPGYGTTTDYLEYVGEENIQTLKGNDLSNVKPGDFAYTDNHIGVIVDVNTDAKEITVVHTSESGEGVNITVLSTQTGEIVADDTGVSGVNRTGQEDYFTEILHVPYDDE